MSKKRLTNKPKKNKVKKMKNKEKISLEEMDDLINELELAEDEFERLIDIDPNVCPKCGVDLDFGDHTACSLFE